MVIPRILLAFAGQELPTKSTAEKVEEKAKFLYDSSAEQSSLARILSYQTFADQLTPESAGEYPEGL
ncbi:MAG: hypothetical protein QXY76_03345 [Nitrososphaeria archaeon]